MTRGLSPFRRNEKRTPGVNSAPMGVNSGEMGTVPFRRRGRSQPAGAVLLEVLISLALLVFGMSVVGLQINMGLEAARHADLGTKAVMLADSKMAELSAGVVLPEINDEEMTGDFGTLYPGFSWRLRFRPTDEPTFLMVTLDIGYNESVIPTQLASPESELEFEDLGNKIVQTVYRLMPIPADVDLTRDFGLDQDKIAKRMELAGLGAGGAAGELSQEGAGTQPAGGGAICPAVFRRSPAWAI